MTGQTLLRVHKRIKDIGSVSKRQFQRRIKNKLQLLLNNNPAIPINPDIQSSSQLTNLFILSKASSNEEINSINCIESCPSMNVLTNNLQTNQFYNFNDFPEDIQPVKNILCATSSIRDKNKDLVQQLRKWAVQSMYLTRVLIKC
ncbi:uncharacterized protein LOC115033286 [Acyrthosiphon pisum]|uniref:Uncharacterized protein n=1 Tax=Acyrthosiphon pisum TaxID=7029 RepID=A0A8R2JLU7_ACYPI|nr:uncharacterized protein LOC115033286 [Acyrthosiphon pisum]